MMGALFVPIIAFQYSYNNLFLAASWIGFFVLIAIAVFLWRESRKENSIMILHAVLLGMVLGVLWVIEISINNFIAPPLPARDIIDNIFWAFIALSLFVYVTISSYQSGRVFQGIQVGTWSGMISGIFACCMALGVIVFGIHWITRDPLNIAEWAYRAKDSHAPSMEAYFAYETMAGAFLHLIGLGGIMGMLLGILGGTAGKVIKNVGRFILELREQK
jgi:hypothetical protein